MSENLSDLVRKEQEPAEHVFQELPEGEAAAEDTTEVQAENPIIGIMPLSEWFESNYKNFININPVKVSIKGVNPEANLLMAVKNGSGVRDTEGNEVRELFLFNDADTQPVLAMDGMDMQVYNNGFKIVYDYGRNIFIKCYGIRTGLIASFCNNIDGRLIPYAVTKVKRRETEVDLLLRDPQEVRIKLQETADVEALEILYKQISKAESIAKNYDAVSWLLRRQAEVTDINHHLQIDNVIIATLA